MQTIASTRTRSGLRVTAELDTRSYPLGVCISPEQLRSLPIEAHAQHGSWNYTIHSAGFPTSSGVGVAADDRDRVRSQTLTMLADERLTGMSHAHLTELTERLAPAQAARAEQRCFEQRGGRRRRAPGAGARALLSDAAAVLITIIYLRQVCSQRLLSEMLQINPASIGNAIAETRALLEDNAHRIAPTAIRFTTAADLRNYLADDRPVRVPSRLPEALSDPALTGMSRQALNELIERLAMRQAALVERRRFARRGGHRLPGARGGIFRQKITDAERILVTVLHLRQLCTRATLAELFQVSPRTIGNALLDIRPLLEQDGFATTPAPTRYRNASAVLAAI
ncbi:hypothetical protein Vau01_109540 [Virgisporangium aurantiacum]|uniref:Uncharacterized protein n=1 Tax=Virgisporangium aurantiacum TaxID=175570 RepID=A0A8J3ZIJ7_9ACTN|nr:hypothetical protein Vau01_109540 [Virgisporangium aurantiacum]